MLDGFTDIAGAAGAWGLLGASAAVFLAGFMRGFVGFGAALVVVPVLSVVFSPSVAVPIAFLSGLPSVLQLLPTAVRHAERAFVGPIAIAAFVTAPLGTLVLASADPALLKIGIAGVVLAMAAFLASGWRLTRRPGRPALFATGALAGFIQGVAGVGGPPAVAAALARAGDETAQRANVIAAVTALACSTAIPLWRLGLLTPDVFWLALLFTPIHSGAAWLGARRFDRGGQRHYRVAALATLAAVGVFTLVLALRDYAAAWPALS